ncbi:MAG: TonB-dependent receptor [candidate division KSB1 bacterium]|nr:TonB-dependent receptor [candidate division KSB1 bacterium]
MNCLFKWKLWLVAGLLFWPVWSARPQAPPLRGRVLDADSRRPIASVNIVVLGTRFGTTTDRDGRFELPPSLQPTDTLMFSHIGYHPFRCSVRDLAGMEAVLLRVRVLPFPGLEVEAQKDSPVSREIPASVTLLPVETVLAEASTDLGDYLQRNASVKIDETLAGQKWLSVRGGNPDEVRIAYDGIPLNTSGSNAFDLAQIDLANLERVELIKGSNTVLFGDGAFAGVLNIVPQKRARYTIRTVARLGTYRAREIALNMFQSRGAFSAGYTFSRRNAERRFGANQQAVLNSSQFHTLWTRYAGRRHQVQARWLYYGSAFNQESALKQQDNRNHVLALNYEGRVRLLRHVKASLIYKALTGEKNWQQASRRLRGEEENRDHSLALRFEARQNFAGVKLTLLYEHLRNGFDADLRQHSETLPDPIVDQQRLQRIQDALLWVLKNRLDLEHRGFRFIDWDLSFRIDWVSMRRDIRSFSGESERRLQAELGRRSYLTYKFGMRAMGEVKGFATTPWLPMGPM